MVWHDRDGAAARDGLAVIAWQDGRRGGWRAEALRPPGLARPAALRGAAAALVGLDVPQGLAPVAALAGRIRSGRLGEVAVALIEAEDRAWLHLSAPDAAALAPFLEEVPGAALRVPAIGLSAEMLGITPPLGAPALARGMDPGAAFAAAMGHLMGAVLHHAPRAIAGEVGPPVHAMRVALRRLRALAGVFAPVVGGPEVDALRAELKALAGAMGAARDWDVFLAGTGAATSAAFPGPPMQTLLAAAGARRDAAYAALRAVLDGPGLHRPALRAAILAQSQHSGARPWAEDGTTLPALAQRVLRRRARRFARLAEGVEVLPIAELHVLRLRAKRLRYAAEAFAPLFPAASAGRYLRRLAAVQEALGLLNDGVVADALMAELGADNLAGGLVRGYVAGAAAGARAAAVAACARLAAAERFWT
jgi:CHAD domain-containing protein